MLDIGGRTLVARHVDALTRASFSHLTVVVGHMQDTIRDELVRIAPKIPISITNNPDYTEGSVVSLWHARADLSSTEATVVMDGDVLYPWTLLARLRDEGGPSAFLIDARSDETGEEMMIGVRAGRARRIARRVGKGDANGPWDQVGESIGFLKVGPAHAAGLRKKLEEHVAAGERRTEYEAVYDKFLDDHEVGVVDVKDAPWTEIDFEEDLRHAREDVLPLIEHLK